MLKKKELLVSGVSGLIWGLIVIFLVHGETFWGNFYFMKYYGLPFSPFVGMAVYVIGKGIYKRKMNLRILVYFVTVFIGAAIYAWILHALEILLTSTQLSFSLVENFLEPILPFWWSLVFYPPLWILFLLAIINHEVIRWYMKFEPGAGGDAAR